MKKVADVHDDSISNGLGRDERACRFVLHLKAADHVLKEEGNRSIVAVTARPVPAALDLARLDRRVVEQPEVVRLLVDFVVEEVFAEVERECESAEDLDVEEVAVGEKGVHESCA